MASYNVIFKSSVEKDLRRLAKFVIARVLTAIEELADEPLPPQSVKLEGKEISPTRCEVTLHSDGIMPSWASDARRNQNNLKSLINYITE